MNDAPYVFVSYARADTEAVRQIIEELKLRGVRTWVDSDHLTPGEAWEPSIRDALSKAAAILVFISPTSMASQWIAAELEHAVRPGVRVLPILLSETPVGEMPVRVRSIQWLDATKFPIHDRAALTALEISRVLAGWFSEPSPGSLDEVELKELSNAFTAQSKNTIPCDDKAPDSVFVVHGQDEKFLKEVVTFIDSLGIKAVVLKEVGGASRSLIDKFFQIGGAARFAIVLLSGDDLGTSKLQFDEPGAGVNALKYRARQNVILELGYFYGLLGWDNVFVLEKMPARRFPDFERPSDLGGVVFDRYDVGGNWKIAIAHQLEAHGFALQSLG